MSYSYIDPQPVAPALGAEIRGVDLSLPLDDQVFSEIHRALIEYQVLFFRDQDISIQQHKAFGQRFGGLHIHPSADGVEGHPEVLRIHTDANSTQIAGERWHSDVTCDPIPPMGSILHMHTVPSNGGDTLFSSMYAAYDALSEGMKAYLGGLTAIHDGNPNFHDRARRDGRVDDRVFPISEHPLIRTHPVSGRKAIFVNPVFTVGIKEVSRHEADAILRYLFDHNNNPIFHIRFKWQPKSIAFWDNRCVQHLALWDYYPETRSALRVTIEGEKPV